MTDEKREAMSEIHASRRALEALATTAQALVEQHGGRAVTAAVAGLIALYVRDLPPDEAKKVQELASKVVADYDQHEARRVEA